MKEDGGLLVVSGEHDGVGVADCLRLGLLDGDVDLGAA